MLLFRRCALKWTILLTFIFESGAGWTSFFPKLSLDREILICATDVLTICLLENNNMHVSQHFEVISCYCQRQAKVILIILLYIIYYAYIYTHIFHISVKDGGSIQLFIVLLKSFIAQRMKPTDTLWLFL